MTWLKSACVKQRGGFTLELPIGAQSLLNGRKLLDNAFLQNLPPEYVCPTHLHRTMELFICLNGALSLSVLNVTQTIHPGEYVVIFPNTPHSTYVCSECECSILLIHFHSQVLLDMLPQSNHTVLSMPFILEIALGKWKYFKGKNNSPLQFCIEGIRAELSSPQEYSEDMLCLYMAQLSILLSRDMKLSSSNQLYENPHLTKATLYIKEHYMEKLYVQDIAFHTNISPRYLSKLFESNFGLGVAAYINFVRVAKAIELKDSDADYPMLSLALDIGFCSQQHFSRVFKTIMGVTPSNYFSLMLQTQ